MSMPPTVKWRYDWQPAPGTAEERLYTEFLVPRDWRPEPPRYSRSNCRVSRPGRLPVAGLKCGSARQLGGRPVMFLCLGASVEAVGKSRKSQMCRDALAEWPGEASR